MINKPLEGYTVLDFTHFLAGPSASMRLADFGARVIKVEKPVEGDGYRNNAGPALKFKDTNAQFYFSNRGKESITIDLKDEIQREKLNVLIQEADIMMINFRPKVTKKLGLDYDTVKKINRSIVYGEITGYGKSGSWSDLPGQDLIAQSISGACYLNGNGDAFPIPFGLPVADQFAGQFLMQGLLAGLYYSQMNGEGVQIHTSLLESMLDIQFEAFSAFLNDGNQQPVRSCVNGTNPYQGAPYGIYKTKDGYMTLAMGSVVTIGELLGCESLTAYTNKEDWFDKQDEIKSILQDHLLKRDTKEWLAILEEADIWCSTVYNWEEMMKTEGFRSLNMLQTIKQPDGKAFVTTRCPIKIDGEYLYNSKPTPDLGNRNEKYFSIDKAEIK